MKSSIVIPVYNRKEYFQACLRSIANQTIIPEVIIADDATDEYNVSEVAREIINDCHVLRLQPRGRCSGIELPSKVYRRAQALNAGAAIATGEIVHLFDQDNVVAPDYLANTTQFHEKYPDLVVYPRTYYLPDIGYQLSHDSILYRMVSNLDNIIYNEDGNWSIVSIRKNNYFRIGGHNNTYTGWGGEDTEFCEVCMARGLIPILVTDIVFHLPHERQYYGEPQTYRIERVHGIKRLLD